MPLSSRSRSGPETQHMEEVAADGVAYVVFPGRRAGSDDQEIRDCLFPDQVGCGE